MGQVLHGSATTTSGGASSSTANAMTGKAVLHTALFEVENADGALMPQMSAQVFFVTASAKDVLVASFAALAPGLLLPVCSWAVKSQPAP